MKQMTHLAFPVVLLLAVLASLPGESSGFFGEWGPDLAGPWCETRAVGERCCTGRDDDCGVPILGTTCYCDIFCNDTAYDCCPDYWPYCHGLTGPTPTTARPTTLPPPRTTRFPVGSCVHDGLRYLPGDTTKDNCNECTCEYDVFTGEFDMQCSQDVCLVRPELLQDVNEGAFTWKAQNYSKFWGMTLDQGVRYRLGTFLPQDDVLRMSPLRVLDDVLPEQFDARTKWPGLVTPVRDQGNCASSWAHSTTAVASDRLSIETNGEIPDKMSAQHLLSCNTEHQLGCEGGHLDRAWWFLRKDGVVTEECYPYTSGKTEETGECLISLDQNGGKCPSGISYKRDKRYKASPPYRIRPMEREIMKEIMDNGPVQATLLVREDFFLYSRGIYSYSEVVQARGESPDYVKSGFHSVRILGWGAERNEQGDIIKYWTCANSWGTDWGEDGNFRIRRGVGESKIESYVVGAWGRISGDSNLRALLKQRRRDRLNQRRGRRHLRQLRAPRERRQRSRRRRRHMTHSGTRRERRLWRRRNGGNGKKKSKYGSTRMRPSTFSKKGKVSSLSRSKKAKGGKKSKKFANLEKMAKFSTRYRDGSLQ